ncbi:hypothetical protein AXF42_Ash019818 [Apostasia shenzhenica]|uniref:RRP15-like protein n=1 Tax=Apostasia shenzhenica TaxID=1088818 RepID=A0A2I0ARE0_9ASPA|nr:hypothetical protein AXF42_Ash019818 [Apostasia shenzhenica]
MVGDLQIMEAGTEKMAKKGKFSKRSSKSNKKLKPLGGAVKKAKKPSKKMIKLFRKRARAYNSDEDEEETAPDAMQSLHEDSSDDGSEGYNGSDDEKEGDRYGTHRGITRFTEGCRAFRTAFLNIMKKNLQNDPLGPILSANRKLVAEKLAEEGIEQKAKAEAKKDKHLAAKTGHVTPASFLDTKEKLLISVATKGVVKLFNAVNKAQSSQNGLNPSNSKDAKALAKQRKATFLSDIKKSTERNLENAKVHHMNKANDDEPAWAPLRDSYMLTSSKLKDWDKMEVNSFHHCF